MISNPSADRAVDLGVSRVDGDQHSPPDGIPSKRPPARITPRSTPPGSTRWSVFGIRHHGPGSARALGRALEELRPDALLIEGPPEADGLIPLAAHDEMRPPVALLAYATGKEKRASFWPFGVFSPEWQAIRYGVTAGIPVRFCDLPVAYRFGAPEPEPDQHPDEDTNGGEGGEGRESSVDIRRPADPLGLLARAAGYDDAERWWDDVIEHRRDGVPPFAAIAEAMAAVRGEDEPNGGPAGPDNDNIREAHMRTVLRATLKAGHERVAVVCGAWHVPALTEPLPTATHDAKLLRGLAKVPVAMTWVPWTHGRLASWRGYGAGVSSPGWYHHLFTATDRVVERWLVSVAAVLREEDLPVSSAHVIEAVRLAEALAVLRGRPLPGLSEVTEATRAVLCDGDEARLSLVQRRLVVGELLGEVPEETPAVPLVRDVTAQQRRLRLAPEALVRDLDLDLRKDNDLARSRLLHRLRLLGVDWGVPAEEAAVGARRGKGTFWESWRLAWAPEFAVDLITASAYGTTVIAAAAAHAVEAASGTPDLATVTGLVERCLLAELDDALGPVLRALDDRVALDVDVAHLMDALPALTRSLRYGDVRGTGTGALSSVVAGLVVRVCVGLPAAVTNLDDDAATAMRRRLDAVHMALKTLSDGELTSRWLDTLAAVASQSNLPGVIAGRLTRLLLDEGRLAADEVGRRMALTLTVGVPPAQAASWIEGFLAGGGLLLVHDPHLLQLVDSWLAGIPDETFVEVLPLLRRTFSTYAAPERRAIGERVRRSASAAEAGGTSGRFESDVDDLDDLVWERAERVLPTLRLLLGPTTVERS